MAVNNFLETGQRVPIPPATLRGCCACTPPPSLLGLGLHLPLPRRRSRGRCSLASWESLREVTELTAATELRERRGVPGVGPGLSSRRRTRRRGQVITPGRDLAAGQPRQEQRLTSTPTRAAPFPGGAHPKPIAFRDPRLPNVCLLSVCSKG